MLPSAQIVPLMVTVVGTLHVGGSLAAVGVMAQLRLTAPVNPYHGVTEIVDVFPVVAPGVNVHRRSRHHLKIRRRFVVNEKIAPLVVPRLFCATAW